MTVKQKIFGGVSYILFALWYFLCFEFYYPGDGLSAFGYLDYEMIKYADGYSKIHLIFSIIISIVFIVSVILYIAGFHKKSKGYKKANFVWSVIFLLAFSAKFIVSSGWLKNIARRPLGDYSILSFPLLAVMITAVIINYRAINNKN